VTAPPTCWVLTDGRASMRNQCLGLAEAAGLEAEARTVKPRAPWRWLPAGSWPFPFAALGAGSDRLRPPWPDVLIAAGRRTVPFSLAIRNASGGATFTVQIESPGGVPPSRFDLVVPPRHDGLSGPNVVPTRGAIHRITPKVLAEAAEQWGPRLAHLPKPRVAVLLGGPNRYYRMTGAAVARLADGLERVAEAGAGIVITPSRRTPAEAVDLLRRRLGDRAGIWDGSGENPYRGYLAVADFLVVTCDSVLMASEAAATGKPVYVAALDGEGGKFERFHRMLAEEGVTRPFTGALETWTYAPLDDAAAVAAALTARLELRGLPARGTGSPSPSRPERSARCPS
jgi:mitochondrial fission protein ELM1